MQLRIMHSGQRSLEQSASSMQMSATPSKAQSEHTPASPGPCTLHALASCKAALMPSV